MEFSTHAITAEWFVQQIVSAVIHSAVYGMAYHIFKGLSLGAALFSGFLILLIMYVLIRAFRK